MVPIVRAISDRHQKGCRDVTEKGEAADTLVPLNAEDLAGEILRRHVHGTCNNSHDP